MLFFLWNDNGIRVSIIDYLSPSTVTNANANALLFMERQWNSCFDYRLYKNWIALPLIEQSDTEALLKALQKETTTSQKKNKKRKTND